MQCSFLRLGGAVCLFPTWALGLVHADLGASALALYSGSFLPFSPSTAPPARAPALLSRAVRHRSFCKVKCPDLHLPIPRGQAFPVMGLEGNQNSGRVLRWQRLDLQT